MIQPRLVAIAAAAVAMLPASADASDLYWLFSLEGAHTAGFIFEQARLPDSFTSLQAHYANVFLYIDDEYGADHLISFGTDDGASSAARLTLSAPGIDPLEFTGDIVFTGTPASPIFAPGVFHLDNPVFGGPTTLTIYELEGDSSGSIIPEPGSWVMLIAGFGLVGAARRHRRHRAGTPTLPDAA